MTTKHTYEPEFQLTPPAAAIKTNRHIKIALAHLDKRREVLIAKRSLIAAEIEDIDAAVAKLVKF